MRTCNICPYIRLHPFTKLLPTVLPPINLILMSSSRKRNLLFFMNNFNHKNMDEYVDNRQETSNLLNTKLVNTKNLIVFLNYVPTMMIVSLSLLIDWALNNALIDWVLYFSKTNWLNIAFFEMILGQVGVSQTIWPHIACFKIMWLMILFTRWFDWNYFFQIVQINHN